MGGSTIKKKLTIILLIIINLSTISIGFLNVNSNTTNEPTHYMIANYDNDIIIDGKYDDWDNTNVSYFDLYSLEENQGVTAQGAYDPLVVTFNFAYNDTFLFFHAYIPATAGHVKAMAVHLFGKTGQDDGVLLDPYEGIYQDLAISLDVNGTAIPVNDESVGGATNAIMTGVYYAENGTYFEFAKEIRSGDSNGKDIHLDYGQAIAVELAAWINAYPSSEGPNYGTYYMGNFLYIRLDIGANLGDVLEIYPDNEYCWEEGSTFDATYYNGLVSVDGLSNEEPLAEGEPYQITLKGIDYTSGLINPDDTLDIEFQVFHDGVDLYFFVKYYNPVLSLEDWFGIVIGKSADCLNYPDGADFLMVSSYNYLDAFLPGPNQGPIYDEDNGGVGDGAFNASYDEGWLSLEFSKPLKPNDPNGRDFNFDVGDYIYIAIVLSEESTQGPNYFDGEELDSQPCYIIHGIHLLKEGEEPNNTNGNTFTLGFSFVDLLTVFLVLTPIIVYIYRKKYKR